MSFTFKNSLFLVVFIFGLHVLNAQNDTIYYNSKWKVVQEKDSALFYRLPITKQGDLYQFQDYYISGTKQMVGNSLLPNKEKWQGTVTWYKEDGSMYQQGNYDQGYLHGDFITYLNGKKLTAHYERGVYISGKRNTVYGGQMMYSEKVGDTIREVIHQDDINGIRLERVGTPGNYEVYTNYFGKDGKLIGRKTKNSRGDIKGEEVFYYYNPMRVQSIKYYSRNQVFGQTDYYPNEQVRALFQKEPKLQHTYFTPNGKQMGVMEYMVDRYGKRPQNGTSYLFGYGQMKDDYAGDYEIQRKTVYTDGKINEESNFYSNGKLKSLTSYSEGYKNLQISYDESGKEMARMEYKNYAPFNGTEFYNGGKRTFKEGVLMKEIVYHPKTEKTQIEKTNEREVFYDTDGNQLGELLLNNAGSYPKPDSGQRFSFDYYTSKVNGIEEYKEGNLIRKTSWRNRKITEDTTHTFKRIEEYEEDGFNKVREVTFYSNGEKQSETDFKKYNPVKGVFYDNKGKILGSFDFEKKEGTRYKFFNDSDWVNEYEVIKNGQQLAYKKYDYGYSSAYGNIDPVLVEDIDINCCASFYDREGSLIAKVEFKDQKPWAGTYYDTATRELYEIKEGKKSGVYQKLDYNKNVLEEGGYINGLKEGVFKKFTYSGELTAQEIYKKDKLDGIATYYNDNGEKIAQMEYKNGVPFDGVRSIKTNYNKGNSLETYKNGVLVKEETVSKQGRLVKNFMDSNRAKCEWYYPTSEKLKYSFQLTDGYLDGSVVKYGLDGNIIAKANLDRGKLLSGTIFLQKAYNAKNIKYYSLKMEKDYLYMDLYGGEDEVLYAAKEKLYLGEQPYFAQDLGFEMSYFKESNLY
ncbi:hypothetical protein [Cytophaga sp. FL35]|uniref:toxin-antitoxin system YwqK family antitoxin n=1 Tax=Cytophaga sp. FL35 TaxID=1904456 RepID=UPI001653969A|nr:hypothetical protein [Cytophaga sp. FL35]MBC6997694.1 hypothetical protein [Cytophaga sp. FL35]